MIDAIRKLFAEPEGDSEHDGQYTRRLAAAALLIEVARADFTQDAEEEQSMTQLLAESLSLQDDDVATLLKEAAGEVDQATSLYQFTSLVNEHYSSAEKYGLVRAMWTVAYADDSLNKYEEHLIRRVADLIYLPHADFIRGKLEVRDTSAAKRRPNG
ncbi:MAG: putative tellurite resistance protein B-like protein [Halieaceae bacterium]|jgi:uncharacterized tellurite resistance protein B-like protein